MEKEVIFNHPLIDHYLTIIRNKETNIKEFSDALKTITTLMVYEITKDLKIVSHNIETPIEKFVGSIITEKIILVPVLRAGLGMVSGIMELIPNVQVGHLGLSRDEETLNPSIYYQNIPKILDHLVIILDPMLATGGSLSKAITIIKSKGAKKIIYMGIIGSKIGIEKIKKNHPDVKIYLATCDEILNNKGYIVPGLGDCGDRLFQE